MFQGFRSNMAPTVFHSWIGVNTTRVETSALCKTVAWVKRNIPAPFNGKF
jgi:hypothetical protein